MCLSTEPLLPVQLNLNAFSIQMKYPGLTSMRVDGTDVVDHIDTICVRPTGFEYNLTDFRYEHSDDNAIYSICGEYAIIMDRSEFDLFMEYINCAINIDVADAYLCPEKYPDIKVSISELDVVFVIPELLCCSDYVLDRYCCCCGKRITFSFKHLNLIHKDFQHIVDDLIIEFKGTNQIYSREDVMSEMASLSTKDQLVIILKYQKACISQGNSFKCAKSARN